MEIIKQVKEYSKRQRIDLNKSDGLAANTDVVIITLEDYNKIKQNVMDLSDKVTAKDKEIEILEKQEQNLKEIIDNVTAPIYEKHDKEIEKKDNQINQLQMELDTLKQVCNKFNIDISQLSAIDILFRKKHHTLINDFSNSIWITSKDKEIVETDVDQLPAKDSQE